jgi:uncharacterized protein with HEPN domain
MSRKNYIAFLYDILDEINKIENFLENINSLQELYDNELVLYATLKSLENIGEAVKNLPENIKEKYPYKWKHIAGLRDILIHHYWGIDIDIIISILEKNIPELKFLIHSILEDINENEK